MMMRDLLNTLFGLEGMGFGESDVVLSFARPIPAWGWAVVLGVLFLLSWLSYWRLEGSARWRLVLTGVRGLVLGVLVLVATGPQLRRDHERTEEDWLVVLLDRSGSMMLEDAHGVAGYESRDMQLRDAIESSGDVFERIASQKQVMWLGFDSGAFEVDPSSLPPASGRTTALGASLREALDRVAGRPVSGVLVLSDGRSVDEPDRELMRALDRRQIPVFTVALGSDAPMPDVGVGRIQAPSVVFVDDVLTAQVEMTRSGDGEVDGQVELVDVETGAVLDRQVVEFDGAGHGVVTVSAKVGDAGRHRMSVRYVGAGEDLISENNRGEFTVEMVDRPLRVVYVDGYPRWEQRYLKNLLMRERSIKSSALLIAANRRFEQEGDVTLEAFPESVEEWAEFDVVIIGDVRPELFGERALTQLREHIADRGAGLIWLGGPGAMPLGWRGSALEDLLPISLGSDQAVTVFDEPVTMRRTEAAGELGLFALGQAGEFGAMERGWPALLDDPRTGWSRLWWAQRISRSSVKPAAVSLAEFTPASGWKPGGGGQSWPGVLMMRFGAGSSVYLGTDEIWRWRYGRGEDLLERFWVPLIRQLGRSSLERGGRPLVLGVSPEDATVGENIRVTVELLDQALIDGHPSGIGVEIEGIGGDVKNLELSPEVDGRGRYYSGVWTPVEPGRYQVRVRDGLFGPTDAERIVRVGWPEDESRRPETNHGLLSSLSEASGGRVLDIGEIGDLEVLLPNREVTIAGIPEVTTLWDRAIVLVLVLVMFGFEWVIRRLIRLA